MSVLLPRLPRRGGERNETSQTNKTKQTLGRRGVAENLQPPGASNSGHIGGALPGLHPCLNPGGTPEGLVTAPRQFCRPQKRWRH